MPAKNKKKSTDAYQLLVLSACGLVLGSVVPLLATVEHTGTSRNLLLVMETAGAAALAFVFSLYLLKK